MRIKIFIFSALFVLFSGFLQSQIVSPLYEFSGSAALRNQDFFDNHILKKAEESIISSFAEFPDLQGSGRNVLLSAKTDYIQGNFKYADHQLETFIKNYPNSPYLVSVALFRAYMAFEQKKYKDADRLFAEAKDLADKEFRARQDSVYFVYAQDALFWRAISLSQKGEYQDAQPLFEECYRKYPSQKYSDDALFALGLIAELNRQFDNALTYFRTVAKTYPYSNCLIASKIREVNNSLILRDFNSALITLDYTDNLWRKLFVKDTAYARYEQQSYVDHASEEILYLKGEAYNIQGNYDQALIVFESFLSTFTESELLNYVKLGAGWALLNKADYTKAISFYDAVISAIKDENSRLAATAQLYRAIALKKSGEVSQAQKEFSALSVQANFPFLAQSLLELGQIYYENKDFDNARRSLERADRESPDANISVRIHLLLGATLLELKKWDKAVNEYKIAEQLALKSSFIYLPQKNWFVAESRLKQGIALVRSLRNSEAITPLLSFIGDNSTDPRIDEAIYWLAEAYYRSDLLNNAAEKYESMLTIYPNSELREEAFYGLGWSNFRLKNFKQSSETFNKMLKEFPDSKYGLEVLTRQGDGYYITRDYKNAAQCYRRAAERAPNSEDGQYSAYQLCHAYYRMGQYEDAITSLLSFVRKYSKSSYAPYALYLTGWIRFQQKKYGEASEDFQFLTQAYPNSQLVPRAYYAIGDCFYNQGNFAAAISSYKQVVESYPTDALAPEALKSMQDCYQSLGQTEEAIKIADKFVETNPGSPFAAEFVFKKGEMFYTGKNYKDAVVEYESFTKKYPDSEKNAEALYWMGKSYLNLNDPDKAEQTFRELQKKYPKSDYAPQSIVESALIRKQKTDIAAADSLFRKVQDLYPESQSAAQAGFERATIKFSLGDTISALQIFYEVSQKYKGMDYADQSLYKIAMYYRLNGRLDTAIATFEILAARIENPTIAAEAQYRIGEIHMRGGRFEEAAKSFVSVREKFAGYEDWFSLALLNLGECYERLEKKDAAIEAYQALITLRPDDDYGKTAKRRLSVLENK